MADPHFKEDLYVWQGCGIFGLVLPQANFGGHFADAIPVGRIVEEVGLFVWIGVEVEEFGLVAGAEVEFPAVHAAILFSFGGDDGSPGDGTEQVDQGGSEISVADAVPLDEGVVVFQGRFAFEYRNPAGSLEMFWHRSAHEIQECGNEIDVAYVSGNHLVFSGEPGDAKHKRDFGGFFIEGPFFHHAMVASHFAMVGAEDDDGVVGLSGFLEGFQDFIGSL